MPDFRLVLAATLGFSLPAGLPAWAVELQHNPVAVVELFTSQGCASCPPADALLGALAERGDVVALSYHVDYWDYAGWPDTFGSPEHTALQRAYVESWGRSRIYTPQIVINGHSGIVGTKVDEVSEALESAYMPLGLAVSVDSAGETLTILAQGYSGANEAVVWLVPFIAHAEVLVERGENAGQALSYTHVAGSRQVVGVWDPLRGTSVRLPLAESLPERYDGAAIIVQEKRGELPGAILGAAAFLR